MSGQLACILWSYATVWRMAVSRGALQAGQDVLITGASSGMGTAAVQISRLGGARRILGTTGSREKTDRLKQIGVDHVLNYKEENVPQRVFALTDGLGVDLVLDCVGGEMLPLGMQCLRMGGTLVSAAQHGGRFTTVDIDTLYRREINIHGARASTRRDQALVLQLAGEGKLDPIIDRVMPLSEAAEAHRILERHEHFGKVVLVP